MMKVPSIEELKRTSPQILFMENAKTLCDQFYNHKNIQIVDQLIDPNCKVEDMCLLGTGLMNPDEITGVQGWQKVAQIYFTAFPDLEFKIKKTKIADNNKVICEYVALGTHLGDFMGNKGTGKRIVEKGVACFMFGNNGKIMHALLVADAHSLLRQIGLESRQNMQLAQQLINEVIAKGNERLIDEICVPNVWLSDQATPGFDDSYGVENLRNWLKTMRTGFPDLKMEIVDMSDAGDKIYTRVRTTATHSGPWLSIQPTNQKKQEDAVIMVKCALGKITRIAKHWDAGTLMKQLGRLQPGAVQQQQAQPSQQQAHPSQQQQAHPSQHQQHARPAQV